MNKTIKQLIVLKLLILTCISVTPACSNSKKSILTGIVEGFYGKPWTHKKRLHMIDFLGKNKFNFYLYGPKHDAYHRSKWRIPYPKHKIKELKELINVCKRNKVIFCFAISPGITIKYHSKRDFNLLITKYRDIYKLGIYFFALFLDDIPVKLKYKTDKKKFKNLANAHINLINKTYRALKRIDIQNRLIVVPTHYHGFKHQNYLKNISNSIPKDIPICWTGPKIVSPKITCSHLKSYHEIVKRKIFIWDNYPVNDFKTTDLFLGPLTGRCSNIDKYVSIYLLNPMNQAYLSKIPLLTFKDWISRKNKYVPYLSWRKALKRTFKNYKKRHRELFSLFTKTRLKNQIKPYIKRLFHEYLFAKNARERGEFKKEIIKQLNIVSNTINDLRKRNRIIYHEMKLWLDKLVLLIETTKLALNFYKRNTKQRIFFKFDNLKKRYNMIKKRISANLFESFIHKLITKNR